MRPAVHLALLTLALLSAPGPAYSADPLCAPLFEYELDPGIPFFGGSGPQPHPWYGGWEKTRPQLIDHDGDGDLDLFISEEDGQLQFLRNDGTPASPSYVRLTDDYGGVHELRFARLADLDADSDLDLLVEAPRIEVVIDGFPSERPGGFLYFNEGTSANPTFVNRSTHAGGYWLDDLGVPITFLNTSPDFTDLDQDGDLDLLFGDGGQGGYIILYRNTGTAQNPVFHLETREYRGIQIVFGGCGPSLAPPVQRANPRHGYMLFEFADIDADGDEDLFIGDEFNSNVYHLTNTNAGSETSPNFVCQGESYFPGEALGGAVYASYLLPAFGDLDGDGDPDALMGSGVSSDLAVVKFTNVGTPQVASFDLETVDWLPELDLGRASAPVFGDIQGDATLDLLVGLGSGQRVTQFANLGSESAPAFALEVPILVNLPNASWAAPELADLDADQDMDLFVGTSNGAVRYWRNDGTAVSLPIYVEITTDPAFGITSDKLLRTVVDEWAVPRFLDDDEDGDLDLLVGSWAFSGRSTLLYFRNDGTPQANALVFVSGDYQNLGNLGQNLAPAIADMDDDGDPDILIGNYDGHVMYVRNLGVPGAPRMHLETRRLGGIDVGVSSVPAVHDLDGDGNLDLVVGESGGGLNFYRNVSEPGRYDAIVCDVPDGVEHITWNHETQLSPDENDAPAAAGERGTLQFAIANVYPSPSRGTTRIECTLPHPGRVTAVIIDTQGRRVATLADETRAAGALALAWDGRTGGGDSAAPGVYQAVVTFEGESRVRRFVRLR